MTSNRSKITYSDWILPVVVWLMRLVVGGVFVFSGFVKAVDPWGSFYKFNEYILTMGWDGLLGLSLFGAFAVPIVETVLGVLVLVGCYRRSAPVLLLFLMLFMLPLTLWLAITDAVPDCGCFGDALILSNWSTFGKNVALTMGIVFLIIFNKRVKGLYGPAVHWIVATLTFIATLAVALYSYFTQPLIDFRPYPNGTVLTSSSSAESSDDDYVFIYSKDGVESEFTIDNLPDENDGWEFIDRRPVKHVAVKDTVSVAYTHQLVVMDSGDDVSDEVLASGNGQLLILFPDIQDVNIAHTFAINEMVEYARTQGAAVFGIASASEQQIEQWIDISMADYPLLMADDSDIKMMARGNPAVMFVERGAVQWKRTLGSIDLERLHDSSVTLKTLSDDYNASHILNRTFWTYALLMLALLVFNRTHVLIGSIVRRLRNKKVVQNDE